MRLIFNLVSSDLENKDQISSSNGDNDDLKISYAKLTPTAGHGCVPTGEPAMPGKIEVEQSPAWSYPG